jgi:hypothetical protein
MIGPIQRLYGSFLVVSCVLASVGFRFFGEGFFKPRAMSANSKNLPLFGGPSRRLSQARSPAGPLRLYLGEIQRPSGEDFPFLPLFGIHYHPNQSTWKKDNHGAGSMYWR